MANKNTKQIRIQIRAAGKRGEDYTQRQQPVGDYHNGDKGRFITQTFPTARVKGDGVNSVNKRRNSCQRVYLNKGEGGVLQSLTAHEPFVKGEYMVFPNHRQYENWEYRRVSA